ncbi:MAG: hypothetical protein IJY39_06605 [Clostridia bacterium]|nr:hypothetical protein [Clostridia bacterium]
MKKYNRIISFVLALVMLTSAFVACDSSTTENTTDAETNQSVNTNAGEATAVTESISETETEYFPDIAEKDYGATFHIYIQGDANKPYFHWVEESLGDALSESIYARQEKVYAHLGVEIVGSDAGNFQTYTEAFKTSVKNKDDSIQLMLSHVHQGVEALITGNYLRDFKTIDQINLDSDYWNMNFMEGLSLNDHMYLGNSNFNILYTHVIAFNKVMMDQYGDALDSDVYSMVKNNQWTLDKMINLASTVYVDATANGKTEDDTFGITGVQWVPFIGFLHASGLNYISMNEAGTYEVSVYNELNQAKAADLVEKLSTMVASDYAWFRYRVESTPLVPLHSERTLMNLISTNDLPNLCDYEVEFGILPYPMYDEAQKDIGYRHLQWGGYLCVPSYSADPTMVGETLEMLSFFSEDVNITFYEKLLGKQVADVPLDRQMLDLVWGTICSEFGQAYTEASGNWLYMLPELTWVNATQNLASYVNSKLSSSNKKISKFMKEVDRLG